MPVAVDVPKQRTGTKKGALSALRSFLRRSLLTSPRARRLLRPVRWGNLRRLAPVSEVWGADRGTPVDRYYIDAFFARHRERVRGRVLEVGQPRYAANTRGQIQTLDIIDIDASNQQATIVGDLCDPTTLADHGPYDCVLAPQTLQYVDDPQRAVANMYAALDEGGILLLTVPAITRLDPDLATVDRWRWTELGITDLVQRMVPDADTQVDGHGNPVVALAFLMGIATEELRSSELDHFDQNFPIVVTAAIIKPHRP